MNKVTEGFLNTLGWMESHTIVFLDGKNITAICQFSPCGYIHFTISRPLLHDRGTTAPPQRISVARTGFMSPKGRNSLLSLCRSPSAGPSSWGRSRCRLQCQWGFRETDQHTKEAASPSSDPWRSVKPLKQWWLSQCLTTSSFKLKKKNYQFCWGICSTWFTNHNEIYNTLYCRFHWADWLSQDAFWIRDWN